MTLNKVNDAIINTGMLDPFAEDICIMYRPNMTKELYTPHKVIESKNDYLQNDFTKEQTSIQIKPISFLDGPEIFTATIHDFNINTKSLADRDFAVSVEEEADSLLASAARADAVYSQVAAQIRG